MRYTGKALLNNTALIICVAIFTLFAVGCIKQHDTMSIGTDGNIEIVSEIEMTEQALGKKDVEFIVSSVISDLKKAGWDVKLKWKSNKKPYRLLVSGSANLRKIGNVSDLFSLKKLSNDIFEISFRPVDNGATRSIYIKNRLLKKDAKVYDAKGVEVHWIKTVDKNQKFFIVLKGDFETVAKQKEKKEGKLNDIISKTVEMLINRDNTGLYELMWKLDLWRKIESIKRNDPKVLWDEKIKEIVKEDYQKFLKSSICRYSEKYFFPDVKYAISEIRKKNNKVVAYVSVQYRDDKNAPILIGERKRELKLLRSSIFEFEFTKDGQFLVSIQGVDGGDIFFDDVPLSIKGVTYTFDKHPTSATTCFDEIIIFVVGGKQPYKVKEININKKLILKAGFRHYSVCDVNEENYDLYIRLDRKEISYRSMFDKDLDVEITVVDARGTECNTKIELPKNIANTIVSSMNKEGKKYCWSPNPYYKYQLLNCCYKYCAFCETHGYPDFELSSSCSP